MNDKNIKIESAIKELFDALRHLQNLSPSPILDLVEERVAEFHAKAVEQKNSDILNDIVSRLNAVNKDYPEFRFTCKTGAHETSFNFVDTYKFRYHSNQDLPRLLKLLELLIAEYSFLEHVDFSDMLPQPPTYKPIAKPKTVDDSGHTHLVQSQDIIERNDFIDQNVQHITSTEIEDAKKKNVEHLTAVKHEIDKQNSEVRELKFKARALEIMDEYVKPLEDMSVRVMTYVTAWLCDDGNDQTVDLIEFSNMISTNTGSPSDALNRLLIEVASINLSQKLINIARFKKTEAPITIHMDARLKERLLSIAVTKLNMVNKQRHLREFDDSHLIIYIIDCCKKNSSLVILESPAEIAQLAQGVYSILLSKNFDSNFVYAADVNNPYDVLDNHWHKKNVVVAEYFDRIKKLGGGQENLVKDIRGIMLNCDITMTTPRLDTVSLSNLFECMHNLNAIDIEDKTIHYGTDSNTFVIGGLYPTYLENLISYKLVCIVSTNDHVAVFIQPTADSYYQEFYTQNHAIKLINWLEYFLPTPEEMI